MQFADVKDGVKCHGGRSESWGGARGAETADRVRMRLDLTGGELEVFLNGDSLGVMVEVSGSFPPSSAGVHTAWAVPSSVQLMGLRTRCVAAEHFRSALLDGAAGN